MGSAGNSKGCGGRLVTRTRAADDGHGGQGSVRDALSSGAACDASLGTPSHLTQREHEDQHYYIF